MTDKKVWLITGAGRGMGADIAKAALAAGHAVVATGRNTGAVTAALGQGQDGDLLAVQLDVTDPAAAQAAVRAAVEQFGRIDVLVNNAGNFYAGFFEEISPQDFRAQVETTLFGPVNVTRAVLPVMRAQGSGWSSRSPRPPASWARSSAPPMPPPSSGWRAGWSR